jgi:hypothetical protein
VADMVEKKMLRGLWSGNLKEPESLGAFSKLRKATISFVVSVRPHGTTRLLLGGFS